MIEGYISESQDIMDLGCDLFWHRGRKWAKSFKSQSNQDFNSPSHVPAMFTNQIEEEKVEEELEEYIESSLLLQGDCDEKPYSPKRSGQM